jgi:hypothetical protein
MGCLRPIAAAVGKGKFAVQSQRLLPAYAVSHGTVLYLFTLRNQVDYYEKNVAVFQKAMATAKITAAQ